MIKIAVAGVSGKMAKATAFQVLHDPECELSLVTTRQPVNLIEGDLLEPAFVIAHELNDNFNVLIDFSLSEGLVKNLDYCVKHKKAMVIGTTGIDEEIKTKINLAAKTIPILYSANMSLGILAIKKVIDVVLRNFEFDAISITESHHLEKKDSPSGTSLMLKEYILNHAKHINEILIDSIRIKDEIGTHSISFNNIVEGVTIVHQAKDRKLFAQGAIKAAKWLYKKPKGMYNLDDILNNKKR